MDFFTQVPAGAGDAVSGVQTPPHVSQDFARAVGHLNAPAFTARLDSASPLPIHPLASLSLSSPPQSMPRRLQSAPQQPVASTSAPPEFTPLSTDDLALALTVPNSLLIDIRPNASYSLARLPRAISLSVPSTLLKRPAFSLQKLSTMMQATSRDRFLAWRTASSIIVYDADTSALAEGNNILGLLRKFKAEGFTGSIAWIRGGFAAVWKEAHSLIVDAPLADASDVEDADDKSPTAMRGGLLQARNLPMSAFQQATTTTATRPLSSAPAGPTQAGAAPPAVTRVIAANPFYNNIRQHMELAHGITERIPLDLPPHVASRVGDLPFQWLRDIASRGKDEEAEMLAMQFYKIELGEQRRLQGIMNHHSQNAFSNARDDFPYSITAGIEKGSKNRYRDIWPFEHSRVRLQASAEDGSDYVNASFICPLGTRRRYIATQGPLPTTYTDFWTLCWEQNVSVIVMLTRQVEGAHVKCGEYWVEERYGPMRLRTVSVEGNGDVVERSVSQAGGATGFDFGTRASSSLPAPPQFSPSTNVIQRKFYLTHDDHPDRPPRLVTQLQYLAWPDVNVPESSDGLLWLIAAVDRAMTEARKAANLGDSEEEAGPVLLHCSAGVGRTGGFIVVDAVLDAVRRELRKQRHSVPVPSSLPATRPAPMDVDSERSSSPPPRHEMSPEAAPASLPKVTGRPSTTSSSSGGASKPRGTALGSMSRRLAPSSRRNRGLRPSASSSSSSSRISADADDTSNSSKPGSVLFELQEGITSASSVDLDPSPSPEKEESKDVQMEAPSDKDHHSAGLESMLTPQVQRRTANAYFENRAPPPGLASIETHSTTAFDYAPPRSYELGDDLSPPPLSAMDEPIREVLEDMRQQRMSLCQSLRQYVFVHRAIIEGALGIVDELGSPEPTAEPVSVSRSAPESPSLNKTPSLKRKQRTTPDEQPENRRDKAAHAASLSAMSVIRP